ncbi:3-hydroxyacyl-CoA dehydrogenase family protein [Marasmitruncus massiliensis]|uniref:3-hydroxyacyl-CoA dehydrogenase family protein n=1 Tax=Marasmitruncus massiliensis TaxID=1944642 RepID=UPI000C7DCF8E|nr:3-hydroxyacyl-CoA dehydrogenase family protein [Marasmitruncus massiliensis]
MKTVIFGSGLMGSGIAAISALAGNQTLLVDLDPKRAQNGIEAARTSIDELVSQGLTTSEARQAAQLLLSAGCDTQKSLTGADLVIEAIVENLEAKQTLFEILDRLLPAEVPILSNTSGLRITDIAAKAHLHPERTMTAHFWFPAHLVPLVEVVMWEKTDRAMAEKTIQTLKGWGKAPVLVKRDTPGQLANRILQAVIREAVNIVATGLATPEDVDTAVKMGMGIRFPVWGPLEHIDSVGLDLAVSVQNTVLPEISDAQTCNDYLLALVQNGNLGYKTGRGIYDWNKKDMDTLAAKRNDFICSARRIIGA